MRVLIIATSMKPLRADEEILAGMRPKLEYIELAKQLNSAYIDYSATTLSYAPFIRHIEEKFKLDVYWANRLSKKIREEGYDVVLSMSERIGIPLAHFLDSSIRHYVILHHPLSSTKLQIVKTLSTFNHCDKLLPLSDAETAALQKELNLKDHQVETVHYAIDTDYYQPLINGSGGKSVVSERFILSLGLSNRDYPTLLEALRKLPSVNCEISGTSAWVTKGMGIDQQDMPSNVKIVHYDHPSLIREAYSRCEFVVIPLNPETSQWSAGSASVLQPQAMGKPVIATRIPGMYDYVLDGKTGLLVDGRDPDELAEAIAYLWNNPKEAKHMGGCARDWVQANHSYERWIEDVCRIIGA